MQNNRDSKVPKHGGFVLRKVLRVVLVLLVIICIFDPADKILQIKYELFISAFLIFLFHTIANRLELRIPIGMLIYLLLFIFIIPLLSIAYYFMINGNLVEYDGFTYFKPYLFLAIVIILYCSKIDLIKPIVISLSVLSLLTVVCYFLVLYYGPFLEFARIVMLDEKYRIVDIGIRSYGNFNFPQIHFYASPLMVFSIGYFALAIMKSKGGKRMLFVLLLVLNSTAMFMGSTRNNMLVSIITPLLVFYWYSKKKRNVAVVVISICVVLTIGSLELLKEFTDPESISNAIKLSQYQDYLNLFADSKILLLGQGLGSHFNTTMRGSVSVTELTYFEFIRRFGIIWSVVSFILLMHPLRRLRSAKYYMLHYIFLCYLLYLMSCFVQPLLMSSTGMLLLSIVLNKSFDPLTKNHDVGGISLGRKKFAY
jgi:hypothetical protein